VTVRSLRLEMTDKLSLPADGSRYNLDNASITVFSIGIDINF
jgi:hypothetical protein